MQEILAALQKHRDSKKGRHKDKKSSKDGASQKRKRKGGRCLPEIMLQHRMCTVTAMPVQAFRDESVVSLLLLASWWSAHVLMLSVCCCRV